MPRRPDQGKECLADHVALVNFALKQQTILETFSGSAGERLDSWLRQQSSAVAA